MLFFIFCWHTMDNVAFISHNAVFIKMINGLIVMPNLVLNFQIQISSRVSAHIIWIGKENKADK
ncbi:unnamed protein product [Heterobilharzia americana]|nr:unnamed protein product [Heterobilharzia americana]